MIKTAFCGGKRTAWSNGIGALENERDSTIGLQVAHGSEGGNWPAPVSASLNVLPSAPETRTELRTTAPHAHVSIAPVVFILRVAAHLSGTPHPGGSNLAVYDEDPAMRAAVGAIHSHDWTGCNRQICTRHRSSGHRNCRESSRTNAARISALRLRRASFANASRNWWLSSPISKCKRQSSPCVSRNEWPEHRWKNSSPFWRRSTLLPPPAPGCSAPGRNRKTRRTDGKAMLKLVLEGFSPNEEEAKHQDDADEEKREGSPLRDRQFPEFLIEPVRGSFSFSGHGAKDETDS